MSNFKLNLPTDIPWKRICVSKDMIDPKICDSRRPKRWNSSIAIFQYSPEEEYQTTEGMLITYIKVACSVTGYQAGPDEIGLHRGGFDNFWKENGEVLKDTIMDYYPCYGAILEVAVAPKKKDTPLSQYPYFSDFEPKKRELYEIATETGEVMSRSLKNLSVGKGSSTLNSHEILDVDHGFSFGAEGSYAGTGGGFNVSRSGEWGTKDISQSETNSIRTTDQSQESRETQSHTTQISQLYHQLDSYHMGTNRAVFFLLPRPHTIETERTFVNGPRNIEGIQEFFFVTMRPKDVEEICVEAYLETGHIAKVPTLAYEGEIETTDSVTLNILSNFDGRSDAVLDSSWGDDSTTSIKSDSIPYNPPAGWEIDLSKGSGGYNVASASGTGYGYPSGTYNYSVTEIDRNHLVLWGEVSAAFQDTAGLSDGGKIWTGTLNVTLTVYLKKVNPKQVITGYEEHLFLTARDLCCCEDSEMDLPFVAWEKPFKYIDSRKAASEKMIGDKMSLVEANNMGKTMSREFMKSGNDIDRRYDKGKVNILETQFVGKMLANTLKDTSRDLKIDKVSHLSAGLKAKITSVVPTASLSSVLQMPIQMQKEVFDLNDEEIKNLRTSLTAANQSITDPKLKWFTTSQLKAFERTKAEKVKAATKNKK
ncbi:hypothetical protein EZ428_05955 [Pedobacter frigiditerrae]|uniref:Uncharacterized protein n=1 Tax=Pedobacter frigiditerrae TaxID=2530452 RepID=A0A4R0N3H5_9SPHI|nr:hypothetical protein [Pedobacter frigiditerrae]TCC94315.1 hypothetical protein EZ428_05955 [Pedobacter frigiditerrae]